MTMPGNGNPFFQTLDPSVAPDPVTPYDAPSNPDGNAIVTPAGNGPAPAPYDISAPQNIAGIAAATEAAMALSGGQEGAATGAGLPVRNSPRQAATAAILYSPQGAPSTNVFPGFPDYENQDLRPPAGYETPIQGHTYDHPGTTQPGVPQFMAGIHGDSDLPGVPPESESIATSGPGADYPGTVQDGLQKYGTS